VVLWPMALYSFMGGWWRFEGTYDPPSSVLERTDSEVGWIIYGSYVDSSKGHVGLFS
jgi:hypothetical protein